MLKFSSANLRSLNKKIELKNIKFSIIIPKGISQFFKLVL